ncbi:hypothetical protein [Vibrio parahaemolyticus]|uniref:hypothetical protein n=1 Tax=Vibrio parahaemolyticus TaxID=670 RepID=UPI0004D49A1C|nr:hypothetical protein [Vibrio parahaemolyticus]EIA4666859.1 hypothetical protein [Vibrio parahaemolyticus]OQT76743.1 hypothetical protein EM98_019435 [Vibrio parahaemolyticus]
MNKETFKVVKKNTANFKIAIIKKDHEQLANLIIDSETQGFTVGQEIEGYLIKKRQHPKFVKKGSLERYEFSQNGPAMPEVPVEPEVIVTFNEESFRFEVKCSAKDSSVCKKHNFTWNPDRLVWQTYENNRISKAIQSFKNKGLQVSSKSYNLASSKIRLATEKAVERDDKYTVDTPLALSDAEIEQVIEIIKNDYRVCAGFFWKSDYSKYKRFQFKNGGFFGTHDKVMLDNYKNQFKTKDYVRRVCHGFDCQTVSELLTRL